MISTILGAIVLGVIAFACGWFARGAHERRRVTVELHYGLDTDHPQAGYDPGPPYFPRGHKGEH